MPELCRWWTDRPDIKILTMLFFKNGEVAKRISTVTTHILLELF